MLRTILNKTPYPTAIFNAIMIRVRTDIDDEEKRITKINYVRASIIKGYLTRKYKNTSNSEIKEVLTMTLNESSQNQAYLLGRLFAVIEKAQVDSAYPAKLNATIKDRYFTAACATPASVFPVLLRLYQHHIAKLESKYLDFLVAKIMESLNVDIRPFPAHLNLDDQGIFILGYYHQRTNLYTKKEKNESSSDSENKEE